MMHDAPTGSSLVFNPSIPQLNVEGGAVAHGHAIGASGAVLATRPMHSMKRDGCKRGIVALCIGGGQGIAWALEMLRGIAASMH